VASRGHRAARLAATLLVVCACVPGNAAALDVPLPQLPDKLSLPQLPDLKPVLDPVTNLLKPPAPPSPSSSPAPAPAPGAAPQSSAAPTAPASNRSSTSSPARPRRVAPARRPLPRPAPASPTNSTRPTRRATAQGPNTAARAAAPSARQAPRGRVLRVPSAPPVTRPKRTGGPLGAINRFVALPVPDWSKPIILALLVLAAALAIRSRLTGVRARRLEAQRAELVEDLDAMQRALVPEVPAALGGLGVSVAYRPAEGPAAGGDFYDVFAIASTGVGVILGDASGHGRGALARSALMRYTLRAYVEAGLEPRAALELAGQVVSHGSGEEFTTVAVAVYDSSTGALTYALAGHPPPIVLGPTAHDPVTVAASPAVGWGMPTGRRQTTVSLPTGALVCLFSDGLTEARSLGQMLGRERLETLLRRLDPRASAQALVGRVRAGADGAPDDMAACIVTPDPVRSASALRVEELELDAQQLEGGRPVAFLEACRVSGNEIASAVADARRVAAEAGAAVLRVRTQPAPAHVTVMPRQRASARVGGEISPDARRTLAPA